MKLFLMFVSGFGIAWGLHGLVLAKDWEEMRPNSGVWERQTQPEDQLIRIWYEGKDVVIIKGNGEVELKNGVSISQASMAIWNAVGKAAPCAK